MVEKTCLKCKAVFEAKNSKAQFCSAKCRTAYCRAKKRNDSAPLTVAAPVTIEQPTETAISNDSKAEHPPVTETPCCNDSQTLPQPSEEITEPKIVTANKPPRLRTLQTLSF